MSDRHVHEPFWTRHAALVIAGGYCLISLIYIVTSDQLVLMLLDDPERITFVQSIKGKVFVIVSSILLFAVLYVAFNRVRRAKQAELAASEQYRTIIETTSEGVWLTDADGRTTFVNDQMATMLGRERAELIGLHQADLLEDEWADVLIDQFERQKCGKHDQCEIQLVRPDGKRIWVAVSASPVFGSDDTFLGCIRMITDISKLKNTEEALKASLKSQRQLLNELDHRVRNNLSSLVSLVEISRSSASDVGRFAESIRGRIDAMNRAYSLLSSSGWKRQNLHRLLQVLLPARLNQRVELAGPHIEFASYLSGAVAIVLHELLDNAIRHGALSNEEGRVGVTWRVIEIENRSAEIEMRLTEGGGPPISDPIATGTGLALVRGLTESDLQGKAMISLTESGARHVLRMRLEDVKFDEDDLRSDDLSSAIGAGRASSSRPGQRFG